ncbi:hypothetical protein BJ878DRAFT_536528 [Calycina marina]|uniref:Uncharacterized protein n=1 Tax=Calycina marina TaxID=1763456 RepID=A0A9P8CBY9_9HELO|nr:hypothetical protein BJ878DRAFT_536528 [Calycina marina]
MDTSAFSISSQAASKSSAAVAATKTTTSDDDASVTVTSGVASTESEINVTGSGSEASSVARITGASTGDSSLLTNLPTLSGAYVIVAPSVPPTSDAPFMQTSSLPEGTVFIVVGAILGFFAMSVLLWRMLVAWSLHRSVKRAAMQQSRAMEKPIFRSSAAPFYKYKDHESSSNLGPTGKKTTVKADKRASVAAPAISNASLFFSPTAGAAGAGSAGAGNRGSNYLPAGYYAAGASQAGNGQGQTHINNHNSISMSNMLPRDRYERTRSVEPSPPVSPDMRGHGHGGASSSTLNLNQPPGDQRTPSVFLDDLFDAETPPPPVPGHKERY